MTNHPAGKDVSLEIPLPLSSPGLHKVLITPISIPLLSQMLLSSVPGTVQTGSAWPLSSQARCTQAPHPADFLHGADQVPVFLKQPRTLQPEPRRPGATGPALLFGMAASSRFPIPSRHTAHHSGSYSKLSLLRYFSAVAPSAGRLHQTAVSLPPLM